MNKNFKVFAFALLVMFCIAFASSAFVPSASASITSPSVSVQTDSFSTGVDFSPSFEWGKSASVNLVSPRSDIQEIKFDSLKSFNAAKLFDKTKIGSFQFDYPDFADIATSPPKYERLYDNAQINGYKFEITPNWRTCKSNTYFFNDYKPELVWRE